MEVSRMGKMALALGASWCLLGMSCPPKQISDFAWESILADCGATDLQKSKPFYFGAANVNGVGSIWTRDSEGDYYPTSQFTSLTEKKDIVYDNKPVTCSGSAKHGMSFSLGAGAKPVVYPASAEIQAAFTNAKSAVVSVDSIVMEDAYWDAMNAVLTSLPADNAIRKGIGLNNRLMVGRAWKVKGLRAVLNYDSSVAATAKAAIDAKAASGTLNVDTKLTNDKTLEITSKDEMYVAGVFRKLTPAGVAAGTGSQIGDWQSVSDTAKVRVPK
ncbi:hypothetical protein [Ralstonia pseudosolanacearum]|uniref:hypothetical protein n=1 Tax=Ralstonia pseudosolanacearum TaxID=1310165 RepID=UPI001FF7CDE3|nr:hypothetical protein [Ralstonia pseudosolanacearum]